MIAGGLEVRLEFRGARQWPARVVGDDQRPAWGEQVQQPAEQSRLVVDVHQGVAAPDHVVGRGEVGRQHVVHEELNVFRRAGLRGALMGDGDHLGGEVDPRDVGLELLGQIQRRAADAAADVEDFDSRPQRVAELGDEVIRCIGAAGADVTRAENLFVAQNPGACVLAVIIVGRRRRVGGRLVMGGLRRTHGSPSVRAFRDHLRHAEFRQSRERLVWPV